MRFDKNVCDFSDEKNTPWNIWKPLKKGLLPQKETRIPTIRCLVSGRVVITEMYWNAANKNQRRTFCLERAFEIVIGFKLNVKNSYNTYCRCQIKDHGWYPVNENCLARQLKYPHGIGKVIFSNHQLLGAPCQIPGGYWSNNCRWLQPSFSHFSGIPSRELTYPLK